MTDRISDVFDVIVGRRKVRWFTDTPAPEEGLMKILDAGRMAPSSRYQRPWACP